jgi:hypothetical protein
VVKRRDKRRDIHIGRGRDGGKKKEKDRGRATKGIDRRDRGRILVSIRD